MAPGGDLADDLALATAFVSGDEAAFTAVYERFARPVHDFIRWTVRDAATAEDLTQNTFLQAYERRTTLRDPAALRGWLFRIAHNLAVNHLTRSRASAPLDDEAVIPWDSAGPEEVVSRSEAVDLVWDAAASLEPRQYAVLDLALRKGLSSAEVGAALGLDAAAASLAVHRAREALGNAVRYLLVARRRGHCERLAELVPEGVRRLTPDQRATVDHHMRRCEDCRRTAAFLTQPAELFALTPLAILPATLRHAPALLKAPAGPTPPTGRSAHVLIGAGAVAAVVLVTTVVVLTQHGHSKPAADHANPERTAATPTATTATIASLGSVASAGFEVRPAGAGSPGASYAGAACPSATTCYVVGAAAAAGVVTVSRDAGASWSGSSVDGTDALTAISCSAETVCVAAGRSGGVLAMLTTSDGGATWSAAQSSPDGAVSVIRCPDADSCLAIGEQDTPRAAHVLASSDGGHTWTARNAPASDGFEGYLAGARCLDRTHCWVVGSGIWFTADLGRTWQDLTPQAPPCDQTICGPPLHTLTDVVFTSPSDGWVVGYVLGGGQGVTQERAYLGHTSDGGASFTAASDQVQDTYPHPTQIECQAETCLVAGRTYTTGLLSVTTDDGSTWRLVQNLEAPVNALACVPDFSLCALATGEGEQASILTAG